MAFDEILKFRRQVSVLQIAAPADFLGDVPGDVARPTLERVKAEHSDRTRILA
jgi:hypothetical protein